jgi:two-component system alkaline phosphatase synthesis response regulator PhoP
VGTLTDKNISILVVDDEPAIREVFKHFLVQRGHDVVTCGTAEEALQNAKQREFDVVILDVILPEMSGLEMAQELQRKNSRSNVIVLTGSPGQDEEVRSRRLKIFRYLSKPIRASVLIDVVEEAGSLLPPPLAQLN